MKRLLHWVDRHTGACKDAELRDRRIRGGAVPVAAENLLAASKVCDPHAILCERPCFVRTKNTCGPEALNRRRPARQHARLRNSPGPHREEDCQDDRKFFRQHRHAKRDALERRTRPIAAQQALKKQRPCADDERDRAEEAHHAAHFDLKPGRLPGEFFKRAPDGADRRRRPCRVNKPEPMSVCDKRAGPGDGLPVAAGSDRRRARAGWIGRLCRRNRLACQQRFVRRQIIGFKNHAIGWNPVALDEDDEIAARNFAPRDAAAFAVTDDKRARACKIAQGVEDAFGSAFLKNGDQHREVREGEQHHGFCEIADREIDDSAGDQEQQHRLAQHVEKDAQHIAFALARQVVEPFLPKASLRFGLAKPRAADSGCHALGPFLPPPWARPAGGSASGQRARGAKASASSGDGARPARNRSIPAQAIIAPLSVQYFAGG